MAMRSDCSCGDKSRPHINHRVTIPCWTYVGMKRCDVDAYGRVVSGRVTVPATELRWWHEKLAQTLDPAHHSADWQGAVELVVHGIERALSSERAGQLAVGAGS